VAELVECRSDWAYAQRPLAFTWQGRRLTVQEVITRERTPTGIDFLVRTDEDELFTLSYNENTDQWNIQQQAFKESA
jgi:hypothetical protein